MTQTTGSYTPTPADKVNICMAYLTYVGEWIEQEQGTEKEIYQMIEAAIPKLPTLSPGGNPDWKVVWGPYIYTLPHAKLQDNGMFVAQQISAPQNYIVAIRGTNGKALADWITEDFEVVRMKHWPGCAGAKISLATYNGFSILLKGKAEGPDFAGNFLTLEEFLKAEAAKSSQPINVTFTGHSLGGALAPTLALFFKQYQAEWDPAQTATVSCTAFAGATAGNAKFAAHSNQLFATNPIRRIHNHLDIVPHAWNHTTLGQLPTLYEAAGITLKPSLHALLEMVILATIFNQYTQISQSIPFDWGFDHCPNPEKDFFVEALCQHVKSYPDVILGEPEASILGTITGPPKS